MDRRRWNKRLEERELGGSMLLGFQLRAGRKTLYNTLLKDLRQPDTQRRYNGTKRQEQQFLQTTINNSCM